MDDTRITYFESAEGESFGTLDCLLPITLYKGMRMTIHRDGIEEFRVHDWWFHHGHTDEQAGPHVILER